MVNYSLDGTTVAVHFSGRIYMQRKSGIVRVLAEYSTYFTFHGRVSPNNLIIAESIIYG